MKSFIATIVFAAALSASWGAAASTAVSPGGSGGTGVLTDLGSFSAGTYLITGAGTVDLAGGGFAIQPDGVPAAPVTVAGYAYFNPNGSFTADGNFGPAGSNARIGALIGTLTATPSAPGDWFLIGYATTVTLSAGQHVYASVNDTFYSNNTGFFTATVTAVPEPAAVALWAGGLAGLVAFAARRRCA